MIMLVSLSMFRRRCQCFRWQLCGIVYALQRGTERWRK